MGSIPLAYILDWGWLRIGPPYIYVNIDPVIVHLGPLALRWYGLMYVVGIIIGLQVIKNYTTRKGIDQDMVYRVLWWCVVAGLIGGRLYFVVQQPNFFSYYLTQPIHIIATWEGGMAFYGAIFLVIPTLFWRSRKERINPLVLIDAGVLFATAGQIFGRIGNLINGDIIGYRSTLPWSTVYQHPNSWACLSPDTCNVPVQPAAGYELIINLLLLGLMFYLARRVRRPGVLMLVYLFGYAITQFLIFFARANIVVSFLGLDWGLKQAQWTSLVMAIVLLPITYLVLRYSKPVPVGEVAATYGISQEPKISTDEDDEDLSVETGSVEDDEQTQKPADASEETSAITPENEAEHEEAEEDGEDKKDEEEEPASASEQEKEKQVEETSSEVHEAKQGR